MDLIKKVISLLEDNVNPQIKRPFYDGDPVIIPVSSLPVIAVEMSGSEIDEGPTGYDSHKDTIIIKVIVDKRVDFNKMANEVVAQKTLRDYVKGVDDDDNLKADSVVGVLRKYLTLDKKVLDQLLTIEYSVVKREEITTEEAWITLSSESIMRINNRE